MREDLNTPSGKALKDQAYFTSQQRDILLKA